VRSASPATRHTRRCSRTRGMGRRAPRRVLVTDAEDEAKGHAAILAKRVEMAGIEVGSGLEWWGSRAAAPDRANEKRWEDERPSAC